MKNLTVLDQFRLKGSFTDHPEGEGDFLFHGPFGKDLRVIASTGEGWDHVSVSLPNRAPHWKEMAFIKDQFFDAEETVIQYHPPKSEYVNNHPNCLHLWRPQEHAIPLPPSILVGLKGLTEDDIKRNQLDGTTTKLSENFYLKNFLCPCGLCSPMDFQIHPDLIERLQAARDEYGKPIYITSGFRCTAHNARVGGEADSAHLTGFAADIACTNSTQRFLLVRILILHFDRIYVGPDYIHVDCDPTKPKTVYWL